MSMLKPSEIATAMRVSTQTIRRLIRDGILPAITVGRQVRVDSAEFGRFLKKDIDKPSQA